MRPPPMSPEKAVYYQVVLRRFWRMTRSQIGYLIIVWRGDEALDGLDRKIMKKDLIKVAMDYLIDYNALHEYAEANCMKRGS